MFKRTPKIYLEVTSAELQMLRASLMTWRNKLLTQGRHTDPIDEMIAKLLG